VSHWIEHGLDWVAASVWLGTVVLLSSSWPLLLSDLFLSFFSFLFSAGFFLSFLACVASSFLLLYFFSCPGRELVVIGYDFDLQVGD
jgi:hypothetical protein